MEEGGACGSDPSGGKPDRTKKRKKENEISAVSKPSFPLIAIENVKWRCIAVYCTFNPNEPF